MRKDQKPSQGRHAGHGGGKDRLDAGWTPSLGGFMLSVEWLPWHPSLPDFHNDTEMRDTSVFARLHVTSLPLPWSLSTTANFMNIIKSHMMWEKLNYLRITESQTYKNSCDRAIPRCMTALSAVGDLLVHLIWKPLGRKEWRRCFCSPPLSLEMARGSVLKHIQETLKKWWKNMELRGNILPQLQRGERDKRITSL